VYISQLFRTCYILHPYEVFCFITLIMYYEVSKAFPLHAMEALGGE
jgi:hypothetical protein